MGIDDMFALVTNLENLTEEEMLLPLEEKIGLVLTIYKISTMTSIKIPCIACYR